MYFPCFSVSYKYSILWVIFEYFSGLFGFQSTLYTPPTLYLQSSPPDNIKLFTGFQSTFNITPSWAFHYNSKYANCSCMMVSLNWPWSYQKLQEKLVFYYVFRKYKIYSLKYKNQHMWQFKLSWIIFLFYTICIFTVVVESPWRSNIECGLESSE
jgi:hypothetical protein